MPQLSLFEVPQLSNPVSDTRKKITSSQNNIPREKVQRYAIQLAQYLPLNSIYEVSTKLAIHEAEIRISKKRHTKLGDYRSPHSGHSHRITVNHDLNKYSFLLTLLHELAHLTTWEKFRHKVKPHGREWKNEFRKIIQPYLKKKIFPAEIVHTLSLYLHNPAASTCADPRLLKSLRNFDTPKSGEAVFHLEDIPENSVFKLTGNTKLLRKGKKLRKRFLCTEINSKRKYLVSPVAEVLVMNNQ